MKVIAINGSPKAEGNTHYALSLIGAELQASGIDFQIVHIGHRAIHGCISCGKCRLEANNHCAIESDCVNEMIEAMSQADGIIIATPVYFAGIAGTMKCFLDRVFYTAGANALFAGKVGASVVVQRRAGGTSTFDGLNHYLHIAQMRQVGASYWNLMFGRLPGDAANDEEGIRTMQTLARNLVTELK